MKMKAILDFETRSRCDIKKHGAYRYAMDPTTEIMCAAIADDTGPVYWWAQDWIIECLNAAGIAGPPHFITEGQFLEWVTRRADAVVAHNSMFEYLIWNLIGHLDLSWPKLPLEKMHDTIAQLAYHALPASLAQAGEVLGLGEQKDDAGHRLMLKMSRPNKAGGWNEAPADLENLIRYCIQDVKAERDIHQVLTPLPPAERKIWLMDQRINLRGVPVDAGGIKPIVDLIESHKSNLEKEFRRLTDGELTSPRSYVALKKWVNERILLPVDSLDRQTSGDLLARDDLDPVVRRVLEIKSEVAKTSVAKLTAMLNKQHDGRIYDMFNYHGAGTGRWTARDVQPHNLPRDSYKPEIWERVADLFEAGCINDVMLLAGDPFFAASRCVRGAIKASPGKRFICADFSSIEARALAYLAGNETALSVFRADLDPYKVAASTIFGVPYDDVDKPQRQVGKTSELALGYQGGIGAYATMAQGYGIDLESLVGLVVGTEEEVEGEFGARMMAKMYLGLNPGAMSLDAAIACDVIKRRWRANRQPEVYMWRGLEEAAYRAVEEPGRVHTYRDISYCVHQGFLLCLLPSGRILRYFRPQIRRNETAWGEKFAVSYEAMKVVDGKTTRQWARVYSYGGKLTENVVQGFCRDLLADAMLRLEDAGYPIVLHVHDEAVAETSDSAGSLEEFVRIMEIVPLWAKGMPIRAEGWEGERYRK